MRKDSREENNRLNLGNFVDSVLTAQQYGVFPVCETNFLFNILVSVNVPPIWESL